jgi:RND family efflux transporter MFP subunit
MHKRHFWFDALTLILLTGVIVSCFWIALAGQPPALAAESPAAPEDSKGNLPSVSVITLASSTFNGRILRRAVVGPSAQIKVISESTARILVRNAQVGDTVEEGAALFELDGELSKIQVDAATAQRSSAEALLAEANAELESARQLEDEELENQTKARRDAAEAGLRLAESRLAEAEISHNRRIVKAPISGVISQCFLDTGEFAASGRPVAEIVVINPARVIVTLTSRELDEVSPAATTWQVVTRRETSGGTRPATLSFTSPTADPITKRFNVVLEANNDDGAFPIGAKVDAICDWETSEPTLTIPRKALVRRGIGLVCFRIERTEEGSFCRETIVRVASIPGLPDVVRVLEGLSDGEQIAIGRLLNLRDGLEVDVQN